jgi:hypothetical protein
MVHVAMFDHGENINHPQPWRVDNEFGVGPAPSRMGSWDINQNETARLKYQLVIYTDEFDDIRLTEQWSDFAQGEFWQKRNSTASGERSAIPYAQWGLASAEGRKAKFLKPDEAVKAMTVNEDFKVNVFASEPMIRQPMAFCWDDKGRLWIAENMDMFGSGNGIHVTKESRILILEDTDMDGKADSKKVFVDGLVFPSGIAVGFDGLWVGAPPNLLFIPDRNKDDKADVDDIEVRLTGWGDTDLHETLNSFNWGPDGWLYGVQGPQLKLFRVSCKSVSPHPVSLTSISSTSALSSLFLSGINNKLGGAPTHKPSKPTAIPEGKTSPSTKTFLESAFPSISVSSKMRILLSFVT